MAKNEKEIYFHGMKTVSVDHMGVQIIRNSLNNGWMLFFSKDSKYANNAPFAGTLPEMKSIINEAVKIGKGGEKDFIQAGTY